MDSTQHASPQETHTAKQSVGLPEIYRILRRRKFLIMAITIACSVLTAFYTFRLPREYQATARVDVDLSAPKSAASLQGAGPLGDISEQKVATQIAILTSQSIAWDVIKKLSLYEPHPTHGAGASALTNPDDMPDMQKLALIRNFESGLSVQYYKNTEIAQVTYRSTDPRAAADIANAVAQSYIARNYQSRYKTTLDTSHWLADQLEELRKQVGDSEKQFADFQRKTGLLQTDETHSATLDKFNQLSLALSAAEIQKILKEVAFRNSTSSDPDLVLSPAALPNLLALRTQLSALQAEYASLKPKYGSAWPKVVQLRSQIDEVQAAIDAQITRARLQAKVEFQAANENEAKLRSAVEAQKQQIFSMNEDALQYSILQRQLITRRALYEDLTRKLQEAELTAGLSADAIAILDPALASNIPVAPRRTLDLEVGALLGLLLGIAVAFLLENVNATVSSVADVELYSGLPILSMISHIDKDFNPNARGHPDGMKTQAIYVLANPNTHFTEGFRNLRSSILLSSAGSPPQVIIVCSAWPQEGKSTISINLAVVLAQTGKRVLLVDADLRRPTLHTKLRLPASRFGLSALLTTSEPPTSFAAPHLGIGVPTLDVLPAGPPPPSASELLMSERMADLVVTLRRQYDFIVVDTAPVLAVSDTAALTQLADTSVIVVRAGTTRRQSLRAIRQKIDRFHGKIAGVVLNDVKATSDLYYEYYGEKENYGAYYTEAAGEP